MSKQDIEIQLIKLGKNKIWLLQQLQKRGFSTLHQSSFSGIISGTRMGPMATAVLKTIPLILKEEMEKQKI